MSDSIDQDPLSPLSETLLRQRYKIIAVLGVGGFGRTYLAEDILTEDPLAEDPLAEPNGDETSTHENQPIDRPQPRKPCVIKQFHPLRQDPQFLETARRLFDTEVATLQQLGKHPQIPDFIDAFEQAGEFYLVQEFIAGSALSTEMAARENFDETRAIDLLRDVLQILEFVHSNQVIHRDIKPANLIRRQPDGKIVVIDFGAVKAIQTQLALKLDVQSDSLGQSNFTVGIGTQGYSPSEQMVGQPRFCSDLFALGVTVIQALTGLHPTQLPLNPDTGEFIWQDRASVSAAFAAILERMVRYHFSQRYQSARQVLDDLDLLYPAASTLTAFPYCDLEETRLLPPTQPQDDTLEQDTIAQSATETAPYRSPHSSALRKRRILRRPNPRLLALVSLGVTALVLGVQQLGGLEPGELAGYDRMMRLRPAAPLDDRLLLVEISEADLQTLKRPTPADRDVAQVIRNLAEAQPRVIGLDLHRELPQEPGHTDLMQQLQTHQVVTILKLGNGKVEIPPPPGTPADRAGFSDLVVDPDGIIRRNLMLASFSDQEIFVSFSLQLALTYLAPQGITPENPSAHPHWLQLGKTLFPPLQPTSGGYQNLDAGGYQILLDYPSPTRPARSISFLQALQGNFDRNWVRDKVVLVGTTAPSGKDLFSTPYSASAIVDHQMPGVVLHAQMVSQILRSVLDGRLPFCFLPTWIEALWITAWAAIGASFAWAFNHPLKLAVAMTGSLLLLSGITIGLFFMQAWVPLVAPAMALILGSIVMLSYRAYRVSN